MKCKKQYTPISIFFLGAFLFCSIQGQAMDFVWGVANSTGVTEKVVYGLTTIWEVPKTTHDQFNEHITKLHGKQAEEIYQKEMAKIEYNMKKWPTQLTETDEAYQVMKAQVLALYNRGEIALLTVDYVSACRSLINTGIENIDEIIQQYKQSKSFDNREISSLEEMSGFLKNIKINLGATLQTKYHYERGGSVLSRWSKHSSSQTMRLDDWGVSSFPVIDLKTNVGLVKWLRNQASSNITAKNVGEIYQKYLLTIDFILKHEDTLMLGFGEQGGIDYYRKQLIGTFGANVGQTPVTLHSTVFGINDKTIGESQQKTDEDNQQKQ